MKNKQEIIGLIINIALVVLLFCFIVAGLNVIGIYSLPEPIEKLLGTYESVGNSTHDDDGEIYNLIGFDEESQPFSSVKLDYNNAVSVLNDLNSNIDYSQRVKVAYYFGDKKRNEILDVVKKNGLYSVSIADSAGKVIKTIVEDRDSVSISDNFDEKGKPAVINKGNFNVSDECGFVLTVDEFLESGYVLSSADFTQIDREDGVYVSVNFNTENNGNVQQMKYIISLDFGVVTEAYCYEDGTLVYEMITESLNKYEYS